MDAGTSSCLRQLAPGALTHSWTFCRFCRVVSSIWTGNLNAALLLNIFLGSVAAGASAADAAGTGPGGAGVWARVGAAGIANADANVSRHAPANIRSRW